MRHLLLTCISLLFCINSLAEEVVVELHRSHTKDRVKDNRSITLEPTATIDGNTICIYTNVAIMDLQTSIKDSMGNTVYTYNDATPSRCHTFEVYGLPEGEYIIEFTIGEDSFYGNFIIDLT